ncbi:diphosphomevalonate decarboxylase [Corynebacterium sp. TAE3-ERU12]|uniref:diphosphomevalonate decarboxylase n=1 Tax=Corynebacterium sp. TAE3-ERU12 TaxID=2849491 RepID=UPI001C442DA3|nr:diphosphomevalonate decarboxylase [Corynebacterium sp. TAE3-ERU12]MBV7294704.1 diphosphomevalonate decarboxylase [Corynebacterium sp. TAE3-ERU12]
MSRLDLAPATATAHPNIALIKYWGKRDEANQLPATGSLSLTLGIAPTRTTVTPDSSLETDTTILGGEQMSAKESGRVQKFLQLVRERAAARHGIAAAELPHAVVDSVNEIPTGAGLASSASGFAALAVAAARAYGMDLTERELSALARRGSGSACRSIFGGLVEWLPGDDDASSYAQPLTDSDVDVALVMAVLKPGRKKIGSREAMRRTRETAPSYPAWVESVPHELEQMKQAIADADVTRIGELAESNALRMHATMLAAVPPVRYFTPETIAALDLVEKLREEGTEGYATMDAGPNVKVLCRPADAETIAERVRAEFSGIDVLVSGSGPGARLVS